MRNAAFIIVFLLASITSFGQSENNTLPAEKQSAPSSEALKKDRRSLIGPAAKNAKPWEFAPTNIIVTREAGQPLLIGPAAKNSSPIEYTSDNKIAVSVGKKKRLIGPAAKNTKPWAR